MSNVRRRMNYTRTDVESALCAAFPRSDAATVLSVIDLYGTEPHELERERVQLAIVVLSHGSEEKLLEFVQTAKTDYRDILCWAESPPLSEAESQTQQDVVRDLLEKWGEK